MPEFFLELFSEEIPARMQKLATAQLETITKGNLREITLIDSPVTQFFGPRRIAISFEVYNETSPVHSAALSNPRERGPRIGAPERALDGFLTKHNALRERLIEENGYHWLILETSSEPREAKDIIEEKLPGILAKLPWPKSMRWGQSGDFTWVRPLRRIVCLLDDEIIPFKLGPVTAGNETEGHRFLAPGAFTVSSVANWKEKLRSHYVITDPDERKQLIRDGLKTEAEKLGLSITEDEALLDEVTGLVEWPVVLIGKIDAAFMDLPPEVRELSMKVNQRYFALRDAKGQPAPHFAFVSNIEATDGSAQIIAGNERVLRARLADARHFWDTDLKLPLSHYLEELKHVTFHAKLGTQRDRTDRLASLAGNIAAALDASVEEISLAINAGGLAKADLATGMVREFPELQGIIGAYYAANHSDRWGGADVGEAIRTHYQPKGPQDDVPNGTVPIAVALADKIDTLVQFFGIGEKPTGSGDPYALRRAALGVIRIILENNVALHLKPLLNPDNGLLSFILERLRVKLRGEGKRFDILDAVLGAGEDDDLVRIMRRVEAVTVFLDSADGANLLAAYRRAANILRIEDAKDGPHKAYTQMIDYGSPEADDLRDALDRPLSGYNEGDFDRVLADLATLRAPVDVFFNNVTVNSDDPKLRRNHLGLLARLRDTMHIIADFSKIEA